MGAPISCRHQTNDQRRAIARLFFCWERGHLVRNEREARKELAGNSPPLNKTLSHPPYSRHTFLQTIHRSCVRDANETFGPEGRAVSHDSLLFLQKLSRKLF